jgi:membrane protein
VTRLERLDRFQRQHRWLGFPLAVVYKYIDDSGGYLSALIAYYGFVSFFPLLLLLTTSLGFALAGDPHLQHQVLTSALRQFPVVGMQLSDPTRIGGGAVGLIVGILGSLYGGLGVAQAVQYAMNTAWRVPRNRRLNPLRGRLRSLLLLLSAGVAVLATTFLSIVGSSGAGSLGLVLQVFALAASVALNALVFVFVFRKATARVLAVPDVVRGAVAAALVWQLLQSFGVIYVAHVVKNASDTNGVFAFVLGLIAFLYLAAMALVLCVEADVVRLDALWPRSLLTPFTDNVHLTEGDRRAYTSQVEVQRMKGFEQIAVHFAEPPAPDLADRDALDAEPDFNDHIEEPK